MLTKLLLLFILLPAIELILLIEIGQLIGTLPTIALIILTGVLGAFLARRQGVQVLTRMRTELQAGQQPAGSLFDGIMVLVAGAFLMTPGILTDINFVSPRSPDPKQVRLKEQSQYYSTPGIRTVTPVKREKCLRS